MLDVPSCIRLKHPPSKPIVVATLPQFQRVYRVLPSPAAKTFARLGVSTGARYCELISFVPEDFDFPSDMLSVNKSTVEVTTPRPSAAVKAAASGPRITGVTASARGARSGNGRLPASVWRPSATAAPAGTSHPMELGS